MSRRRPFIKPRRPVFLGCEGESEVAYGQILNNLLQSRDLAVHIHAEALVPGAGDPLARVQKALKIISQREKQRGRFRHKSILLDADQAQDDPRRATEAMRLAAEHEIHLIWQTPCHEAFLLRHLLGCSTRKPPDAPSSLSALIKEWPEYEKPMSSIKLVPRIDFAAVQQAAGVEPELASLLKEIGLIP